MNSEIDNRRFYRRPHIEKYSEQMQKITLPSFTKIKCNSKLNSFPLFFYPPSLKVQFTRCNQVNSDIGKKCFYKLPYNEKYLKWMDLEKVSTIFKQLRKDAHAKKL